MATEKGHVVGDIRCDTAADASHGIYEEGEADRRELVRKEAILVLAREGHQVVKGNGTRENDIHKFNPFAK
ncbi:MAG: hypothetical protein ACOYM2_21475 [Rectinemataceae bacterium]